MIHIHPQRLTFKMIWLWTILVFNRRHAVPAQLRIHDNPAVATEK
jgi:hypothetical protein